MPPCIEFGGFGNGTTHSAVRSIVGFGGLLGRPPRVLWQGRVLGEGLLVGSLFSVESVHAGTVFYRTCLALSAPRDGGSQATAALSFLLFSSARVFALRIRSRSLRSGISSCVVVPGGFLPLFCFLTLTLGLCFGAIGGLVGLVGSEMVDSKLILLE